MSLPLPPDPAPPAPVRERAVLPDVLRGVALLGILLVNMQDFSGYLEWRQRGPDQVAQILIDVLANGRFISIFAMLFGWGAYGLYLRHGGALFVRRHLLLLALGVAHHVLVWHGDIISLYALLAFALPLAARLSVRGLLSLAALSGGWWLLNLGLSAWSVLVSGNGLLNRRSGGLPDLEPGQSYAEVLRQRAADFPADYLGGAVYNAPWILALFLLGAAAARAEVLTRPERFGWLFRRLAAFALPLGLGLGIVLAYLNTRADLFAGILAVAVRMSGGLAGALGYVGLLGTLCVQGRLGWWRHFAGSGRVALSNYLGQSLLMTLVFYPYAGAQWGQWGAASTTVLALALALLQLPLSRWWLRRLGSGPLELALRRLIYSGPRR